MFETDVELKLRMAGIKVVGKEEIDPDSYAGLLVNVNTLRSRPGERAAYSISVSLRQGVRLYRNGELSVAGTWDTASVGYGDLSAVRNTLKNKLDAFINAWLSVNPK